MMENKRSNKAPLIAAIILAVVAVGGAAYALSMPKQDTKTANTNQTAEEMSMSDEEHANMDKMDSTSASSEAAITFTNKGFDKSTYTFEAGKPITVKNESSMDLQFSSDDHPTHREHPELNMNVLSAGKSGTFTPPGKGTYMFHDHINDQFTGTLIIQ